MDKKDWDDIIEEPVSEELKHKTMVRVRQELEKSSAKSFDFKWLALLVPGLAALLLFIRQKDDDGELSQTLAQEDDFIDEIKDLSLEELAELDDDFIDDLEFYEDLDILEDWDGSEES